VLVRSGDSTPSAFRVPCCSRKRILKSKAFSGSPGFGGLFVLPALAVVPGKPDEPGLGMPAEPAWKFRSLLVPHVICFLPISQSVKRALIRSWRCPKGRDPTQQFSELVLRIDVRLQSRCFLPLDIWAFLRVPACVRIKCCQLNIASYYLGNRRRTVSV